eukprot:TRINITY_DN7401_c0_g1_i3.p4 TRINITY_DN7401_c0_g1~~TRINITY_DN7401_c0_g1_i3.p4  ORF type:complete len:101 (-),score=14.94 TRINITY_DN7401_c0_g1_i3:54-356(-)
MWVRISPSPDLVLTAHQPQENSFEVRTWSIVSNTTATESLHGLQHVETRRGGKSGIGHSGMWGIHAVFEGGEDKQMIISSDRDKAKKWAGGCVRKAIGSS